MNDLSVQPTVDTNTPSHINPAKIATTGTGNKEVVDLGIDVPEGLRDASGKELAMPKEVVAAGIKVRPTTIPIPPPVAKMGVRPAGANVPVQTTTTVVLPLSDTQIAQGLHESITDSLRWFAEWCIRRLKQIHAAMTTKQGKSVGMKDL